MIKSDGKAIRKKPWGSLTSAFGGDGEPGGGDNNDDNDGGDLSRRLGYELTGFNEGRKA